MGLEDHLGEDRNPLEAVSFHLQSVVAGSRVDWVVVSFAAAAVVVVAAGFHTSVDDLEAWGRLLEMGVYRRIDIECGLMA